MAGENTKVYHEQGGNALVVKGADGGVIKGTASANATPAQAGAIADLAAITGGDAPTEAEHNAVRTAINSILAALRGTGVIAP